MRNFTIVDFEIDKAKGIITFECRDFEQEMFNEFRNSDDYEPYTYPVIYDCRKQAQANLLTALIKQYAPQAKSLTEGATAIAAMGISEGKSLLVYWSKDLEGWFFKYWR